MQLKNSRGFTALEVMLVLGVIGILAAVALPWYRDYTVRARVGELIHAAASCKTRVGEFYLTYGRLPASAREAGCPERVTSNANPLAVFNGQIIIQAVGNLANQLGARNIFALRAVCSDGECQGAPIQEWVCSPSGQASTTILPKYLPTSCR